MSKSEEDFELAAATARANPGFQALDRPGRYVWLCLAAMYFRIGRPAPSVPVWGLHDVPPWSAIARELRMSHAELLTFIEAFALLRLILATDAGGFRMPLSQEAA